MSPIKKQPDIRPHCVELATVCVVVYHGTIPVLLPLALV